MAELELVILDVVKTLLNRDWQCKCFHAPGV